MTPNRGRSQTRFVRVVAPTLNLSLISPRGRRWGYWCHGMSCLCADTVGVGGNRVWQWYPLYSVLVTFVTPMSHRRLPPRDTPDCRVFRTSFPSPSSGRSPSDGSWLADGVCGGPVYRCRRSSRRTGSFPSSWSKVCVTPFICGVVGQLKRDKTLCESSTTKVYSVFNKGLSTHGGRLDTRGKLEQDWPFTGPTHTFRKVDGEDEVCVPCRFPSLFFSIFSFLSLTRRCLFLNEILLGDLFRLPIENFRWFFFSQIFVNKSSRTCSM